MNRVFRALMYLVIIGGIVVGGASQLIISEIDRPADPEDDTGVTFVVEPGMKASDIAANLGSENLIRLPLLFQLMAREQKVGDRLQAGEYQLARNMTMAQILTVLQDAPSGDEREIGILPGWRLEEIAASLAESGAVGSAEEFLAVARNPEPFKQNHARLQGIPEGQSLEGYLFPDTYRIDASATVTDVIETILTDGFDANYSTFESEVIAEGPNGPPSVHEVVTMASIVQREAANEQEMPHLAWIFWNRLKPQYAEEVVGRLQADPTLQYALGKDGDWWPNLGQLSSDELNNNQSEYNTRIVQGLPPGPIASSSLFALRSAARPGPQRPDGSAGENDLYFVVKCGSDPVEHEFAANSDEFYRLAGADGDCSN